MHIKTEPTKRSSSKMETDIFTGVVENYRLSISQTERLYVGEGRNYRMVDDTGDQYILKVYESEAAELISFITTILVFLGQIGIPIRFPRPIKNIEAMNYTLQPDKILLVFQWIEGTTLESINARIAQELGQVLAILDSKLGEFYDTHERDYGKYENSMWSVTNIHKLDKDLEAIRYLLGEHYGLIKETMAHFDKVYPAIQDRLNKSLIHNDINPGNLLYDRHSKLTGIIDFTEICHTYRICEVGVALAYLMQISGSDYLNIGQSFIKGYAKNYRFTMDEKKVLLLLSKLRLSITIIYNTLHVHSGNALTDVQAQFIRNAKDLLSKLSRTTSAEFMKKMFPSVESRKRYPVILQSINAPAMGVAQK